MSKYHIVGNLMHWLNYILYLDLSTHVMRGLCLAYIIKFPYTVPSSSRIFPRDIWIRGNGGNAYAQIPFQLIERASTANTSGSGTGDTNTCSFLFIGLSGEIRKVKNLRDYPLVQTLLGLNNDNVSAEAFILPGRFQAFK